MSKISLGLFLGLTLFAGNALRADEISGSMRSFPLHAQWLNDFARDRGSETGQFYPVGEKMALDRHKKKQIQLLSLDSSELAAEKNLSRVPVAKGAMVLAYNLPNFSGKLVLTPALLQSIFEGQLRSWTDPRLLSVNPTLKSLKETNILPVYSKRSEENAEFLKYLTRENLKQGAEKNAKSLQLRIGLGGDGQDGVSGLIEQNSGSLGFVSLAYALGRNLRLAEIQDSRGIHRADQAFAQNSSYPLTFTSYLAYLSRPDAFAQNYIQFILSKGQNRLPPGYGSLSVTERAEAMKILLGQQKGSL